MQGARKNRYCPELIEGPNERQVSVRSHHCGSPWEALARYPLPPVVLYKPLDCRMLRNKPMERAFRLTVPTGRVHST